MKTSARRAFAARIIMKLFTKGFNYERIADELLCDKRTVQSWTAMKSTPNDEYWECLKMLEKEYLDEVS